MPPLSDLDLFTLPFAIVLGALLGSFANVVVHRLPRGESVLYPPSHCPNCGHRLMPLELVPVFSWLGLGGRCRKCRNRISFRYPAVELLAAAAFTVAWLRFPPSLNGWAPLLVGLVLVTLLTLAAIDIDTHTLPDALTLPALLLALLASLAQTPAGTLPEPVRALAGATVGAGALALVNRLGGLVLRRFRDTSERSWPIGFDNLNIAALTGMAGGWRVGVGFLLGSLVVNLVTRRTLRWPEPTVYLAWLAALLLAVFGITLPPLEALAGSVIAAGSAAILGASWWWLYELGPGQPAESNDEDEPVALGFGDVKLAAVLGALLGPELLLLALFLSFPIGALGGVTARLLGGGREVPFGPYLVLAGVISLLVGQPLVDWYLALLTI